MPPLSDRIFARIPWLTPEQDAKRQELLRKQGGCVTEVGPASCRYCGSLTYDDMGGGVLKCSSCGNPWSPTPGSVTVR